MFSIFKKKKKFDLELLSRRVTLLGQEVRSLAQEIKADKKQEIVEAEWDGSGVDLATPFREYKFALSPITLKLHASNSYHKLVYHDGRCLYVSPKFIFFDDRRSMKFQVSQEWTGSHEPIFKPCRTCVKKGWLNADSD